MRATPRDRRFASTITRPPSCSVMSEGRCGFVRIRRMLLERRAVRDADEVGAERARLRLDRVGGQRLLEDRDHQRALPSARFGLRRCARLLLLELLQLARHHALVALRARPSGCSIRTGRRSSSPLRAVLLVALAERDLLGRASPGSPSARRRDARDSRCRPGRPRGSAGNRRTSRPRAAGPARSRTRRAKRRPRSSAPCGMSMKRSKNCRMVEKPNSCASVAQARLSMPKCSTASAGQECRQRLQDSPMHTCSVIGWSGSSSSSVRMPVR